MKILLKRLRNNCSAVLMLTLFVGSSMITQAQSWPNKPMKMVIPFAAGGTTDVLGRLLAQQLTKEFNQSVVIENKAGAGGNIAAESVAQSPADGYTIMLASGSMLTVNPFIYKKAPVNYSKDFIYITNVASGPMLFVVSNKLPVKNLQEFIALAKTKELNFGSAGIGTQVHMAGENLVYFANISSTHIPYKGESAALNDLLSGQIDFMVSNLTAGAVFVKSGQIKAIGVRSAKPVKQLPNVPSLSESGLPGFESTGWFGLAVPANTPNAIVERIYASTINAVNSEAMKVSLDLNGLTPVLNTPKEFEVQIRNESIIWEKVIKARNISTQ